MTESWIRYRLMPKLLAVSSAVAVLAGCATAPPPEIRAPAVSSVSGAPADVRAVLTPAGALRIAVYTGSPTSMVRDAAGGEMRGVAVEVGRELARRLQVPAEVVVFQRVAEVVDALKAGRADFTVTNATPARAQDVDFTPPLLALELGYLSLPGSPVQSPSDIDRPGVRVGVSQGSSSRAALTRSLQHAQVVAAPSLEAARGMLQRREIDAFATNKAILFELADRTPGARVLEGRWGFEQLAIAVPQGRAAAASYLRDFAASVREQGLVRAAAARAGLRGAADPP